MKIINNAKIKKNNFSKNADLQLIFLTSLFFLTSCSEKKVPLEGKRDSVDISQNEIANSKSNEKVILGDTINPQSCTQPFYGVTHAYDPVKYSCKFQNAWTASLSNHSSNDYFATSNPICVNNTIYCIDQNGYLNAIKSGKKLWSVITSQAKSSGQSGAALLYHNGKLYCSTSYAELMCIDSKNGKILWRKNLPSICKGDALSQEDNIIFALCFDNTLIAIDIVNGNTIWTHSGLSNNTGFTGTASVAIDEKHVYVGYTSGDIYALNKNTGEQIWNAFLSKFSLDNVLSQIAHPRACPLLHNNMVIFTSQNGQIAAFNKQDGKIIWEQNCGGLSTPMISGNSLFVIDGNNQCCCLSADSGKFKWIIQLDVKNHSSRYGCVLTSNGIVAISLLGECFVIDAYSGKIKSKFAFKDDILSNPVVVDGSLYVLFKDSLKAFK